MILLKNNVETVVYRESHPIVKQCMLFASTVTLSEPEINAFDFAFSLFEQAVSSENLVLPSIPVAVYLTSDGSFSLQFVNNADLALYQRMIVIAVDRWRVLGLHPLFISVILLEELCHCFWDISDESLVKDKVVSIFQQQLPFLDRNYLYAPFENPRS